MFIMYNTYLGNMICRLSILMAIRSKGYGDIFWTKQDEELQLQKICHTYLIPDNIKKDILSMTNTLEKRIDQLKPICNILDADFTMCKENQTCKTFNPDGTQTKTTNVYNGIKIIYHFPHDGTYADRAAYIQKRLDSAIDKCTKYVQYST